MLTVHLLGHVYVTQDQRTVPISAKATALIAYLSLEKLPQHRERLAELLWDTLEARKNLRVELARIRSAGLNIFPSSHQLLSLENVGSDFDHWCLQASREMNQRQLADWLATLRGMPFTGLEDMGSVNFQSWVDQQRWLMTQQIEQQLSRAYWRYARDSYTWATRLIAERADALGLENPAEVSRDPPLPPSDRPARLSVPRPQPALPAEPDTAADGETVSPRPRIGAVHFERQHEERELLQAFRRAEERPQLVVLHGPPGSGKTYLTDRIAQHLDWSVLRVSGVRSGRLVLARLAQALLPLSETADAEALGRVLLQPGSLDEDMVKVAYILSRVRRPALLVFDQVQEASPDLASLLAFLFEASRDRQRVFMLLSREPAAQVPLIRALRRRTERASVLELKLSSLTGTSVQRTLESQFPFEPVGRLQGYAARLMQRSEGNPLHLLSLLDQAPNLDHAAELHFPQAMRDIFDREIDSWPADLREALRRLSVIYGRFDLALFRAALGETTEVEVAEALLYQAVERWVLVEADPEVPLCWPQLAPLRQATDGQGSYVFKNEGLRVALLSQLPQFLRREVRQRLVQMLAEPSPGLAAYYATRAGLTEETARLREAYCGRLPQDSPLRDLSFPVPVRPPPPPLVAAETVIQGAAPGDPQGAPLSHQGYLLLRDHEPLTVLTGRYGPPSTLTLLFRLPASRGASEGAPSRDARTGTLQLQWRLDVYGGGEEFGPELVPFPLRLRLLGAAEAHVLTPHAIHNYHEQGVRHTVHTHVGVGVPMMHQLKLTVPRRDAAAEALTLELSVRAVDLALTLSSLSWNDQQLLSGPGESRT